MYKHVFLFNEETCWMHHNIVVCCSDHLLFSASNVSVYGEYYREREREVRRWAIETVHSPAFRHRQQQQLMTKRLLPRLHTHTRTRIVYIGHLARRIIIS